MKSFTSKIQAAVDRYMAAEELVSRWSAGDPAAIKRVETLLASVHLSVGHVAAKAAARHLDKVEGFNRLMDSTAWRRDILIREIERRRSDFAERARRQLEQIEDAKFETIATGVILSQATAGKAMDSDSTLAQFAALTAAEAGAAKPDAAEVSAGEVSAGQASAAESKPAVQEQLPQEQVVQEQVVQEQVVQEQVVQEQVVQEQVVQEQVVQEQPLSDKAIEVDPLTAKPAHVKPVDLHTAAISAGLRDYLIQCGLMRDPADPKVP